MSHVAIVAYGPSMHQYVALAKALGGRHAFCDEVWGINAVASVINCDRAFHMDDIRIQEIRAAALPDSNIAHMVKWLKTAPGPIYTSRAHPEYPGLVDFPLEDVLNKVGGIAYLNSTPAYALALAEAEGVERLSLFGLDYTYANKLHAEKGRGCVEYWIGRAIARGVKVSIADSSTLLDTAFQLQGPALYGYGRFGSLDVAIDRGDGGKIAVRLTERPDLPTAEEIEAEYDHTAPTPPPAGGVTQQEEA